MIIFCSVCFYIKKVTKPIKKRTETSSNQPVLVWLGFLGQKLIKFGLTRFFSVWVRFSFFGSKTYKTVTEPVGFFKIFLGFLNFFHGSVFFVIFFGFLYFSVFLLIPTLKYTILNIWIPSNIFLKRFLLNSSDIKGWNDLPK